MQSLSLFYNSTRKFMSLNIKDKILVFRIILLTAFFRAAILTIPFKKLNKYIGDYNKESRPDIDDYQSKKAIKISSMIDKVAGRTPWQSKCLVRALTAQYLLKKSNIDSTLYLGIGKIDNNRKCTGKNMIAHAWIRCGELYVTGGDGRDFAVVAKFKKRGEVNRHG